MRWYTSDQILVSTQQETSALTVIIQFRCLLQIAEPLDLEILVLRALFNDVNLTPKLYHAHFTPEISDAAVKISVEIENVNRMLDSKFSMCDCLCYKSTEA